MDVLQIQDENAAPSSTFKPRGGENKRMFGTPLSSVKSNGTKLGASGQKIRKALSNITNKAAKDTNGEDGKIIEGDDSSSVKKACSLSSNMPNQKASQKGPPSTFGSSVTLQNISDENWDLAKKYAAEGIENMAGKSARELDEETAVREQSEIRERVEKLSNFRAPLPRPLGRKKHTENLEHLENFDHHEFLTVPPCSSLDFLESGMPMGSASIFVPNLRHDEPEQPIGAQLKIKYM
ncbi:hypothetical protein CYMTET_25991 [Cymbomonas tetramitiformis]|uniref:Uncharacterized protein n=1 Tax=Cymbomonas tetramitiformis TaxID=36881 RepID=A0AAE0FSZ1_9CHLO|nr:hypothetical protein CYMTET_25991 [Cymbomonas tetramitiformis]